MASTADLLDEHRERAAVCLIQFRSYGASAFSGPIATVRCHEDNVLLREQASTPGKGRVLVVDGRRLDALRAAGRQHRCACARPRLGRLVINGCVRDVAALDELGLGIKALGSNPRPSAKAGGGEVGIPVSFGEITFAPGQMLHSDDDGIVVLPDH